VSAGAAHCRGEFIVRHDADDWSARNRIERQVAILAADSSIAVVGTNFVLCRGDGAPVMTSSLPESYPSIRQQMARRRSAFCHGATAIRRRMYEAIGGYREQFRRSQDLDLFLRLAECHPCVNLSEPLYFHRRSPGAVSVQHTADQDYFASLAYALAAQRSRGGESFPAAAEVAAAEVKAAVSRGAVECRRGDHLLIAGMYGAALRSYLQAAKHPRTWPSSIPRVLRLAAWVAFPEVRNRLFRGRRGS
jgi:hypothetical protein